MIELKRVSKEYNVGTDISVKAIDNISVKLEKGEWCAILGPNASGKSTLLKLLAGSIFPSSGSISLDGNEISNIPQYRRARIFQFIEQNTEENLVPSMTVEENLLLVFANKSFPALKMASNSDRRKMIVKCLSYFGMGLENKLSTQSRFLSGGQKQAVVVARAILSGVKVLLLDEFVAAIDPKTAPIILKVLKNIATEEKITVIMVNHDMDQVIECNSRVIFLSEGRIAADLKQSELSRDKLLSLYSESLRKTIGINL